MKRFFEVEDNSDEEVLDPLTKLLHNSLGYPTTKNWTEKSLHLRPLQNIVCSNTVMGGVYWIRANIHDPSIKPWYDNLLCQPHKNSLAPGQPKKFSVSYSNPYKPDWIGLPRFFGLSLFGKPEKDIRSLGHDANMSVKSLRPLRDYQITATQSALKTLEEWGGATIIADCGAGKTAMALKIAAVLNRKTLVLCNRTFLMHQWKQDVEGKEWTWADDNKHIGMNSHECVRIKCDSCKKITIVQNINLKTPNCIYCNFHYTTDWIGTVEPREGWLQANVGWLQGSDGIDTDKKDIVIASIESISQCAYSKELLSEFGLVIIDEMHHLGALTLSQVLPKLPARYILGISATPERNDGLEHVLYWLAGPTCFVYKRLPSITGKYNTVEVKQLLFEKGKRTEIIYKGGKIGFAAMISCLAADEERNNFILKTANSDRKKILVVSSIVEHVKFLADKLQAVAIHGGCSPALIALAKSQDTKIVVATYQFLEEGYDDPRIDTLIMALPRSKIQQVVGRCERTHEGKLVPLVLDIVDTFSVFDAMRWKRHKFYKSRGFQIQIV